MNRISFSRLLSQAEKFAADGDYSSAQEVIEKALTFSPEDFTANFTKLRLAIILGDLTSAEKLFPRCHELSPQAAEILVPPWQDVVAKINDGRTIYQSHLCELYAKSQQELKRLQSTRNIGILDTIIAFGLMIALTIAIVVIFTVFNLSAECAIFPTSILFTLSIMLYYNSQTIVSVSYWVRFTQFLANAGAIMHSATYLRFIALVVLLEIASPHKGLSLKQVSDYLNIADFLTVRPVYTSLLDCGFVFTPLIRHGKLFAYLVTGILGGLMHFGSGTFLSTLLQTTISALLFQKHKTMAAPILVIFIQNILWVFTRLILPW